MRRSRPRTPPSSWGAGCWAALSELRQVRVRGWDYTPVAWVARRGCHAQTGHALGPYVSCLAIRKDSTSLDILSAPRKGSFPREPVAHQKLLPAMRKTLSEPASWTQEAVPSVQDLRTKQGSTCWPLSRTQRLDALLRTQEVQPQFVQMLVGLRAGPLARGSLD